LAAANDLEECLVVALFRFSAGCRFRRKVARNIKGWFFTFAALFPLSKKETCVLNNIINLIMNLQEKLRAMMGAKTTQQKEENQQWLLENGKREEVVVLPSGLQYEILQPGTGANPTVNSRVTVHYEGKLTNGNVFDSSYKRGQPATFGVTQVIAGWTEALQLMPQGSKWRLYIPSELGYGERGAGGSIPGNAILIFDVELLSSN